ncbi:hypothetical protein LCGC14_2883300, partial [marine sediment metagenome]
MYRLYPGFRFLKSKADYSAVWPTGEQLLLRHMEDERSYGEYHGHEYPWIGWEELTQWATDKAYKMMFSCCRPPKPGVPCRVRSTTNPYGPGHNWVKRRFELPQMRGRVIRKPGEPARVAIHGTLSENFLLLHEQPDYPMLVREAAANPAQAKAWLDSDEMKNFEDLSAVGTQLKELEDAHNKTVETVRKLQKTGLAPNGRSFEVLGFKEIMDLRKVGLVFRHREQARTFGAMCTKSIFGHL